MKIHDSSSLVGLPPTKGLVIEGKLVRLREKKISDAHDEYRWYADKELSELDATSPLNMSFAVFLLDYSLEIRSSQFRRFPMAVETLDGKHIGSCTVYDIDEKKGEAQIGILIGEREYWEHGYGTDAMKTMTDFVFRTTTLNRLYLKTLDWNTRAQKSFAKVGFIPCGELQRSPYHFKLMELTRERWESLQSHAGEEKVL